MARVEVLLPGFAFRTDAGTPAFCSLVLIEGQKRTLVDVGHVGRRTVLQEALAQRGLTPEDIDVIVMTHSHWDHVQNLDLFLHASLLIHRWEHKYAHKPHRNDWATPKWTGALLDFHPKVQEVEEGYEIESGVRIMHTPGHSAGSITVAVETSEGVYAVTGDSLQHARVAQSRTNYLVFWSEKDARRSIDRILEKADVIAPGHDLPFRLHHNNVHYQMPMKLTIAGLDPHEPGLRMDPSPRTPWVMPDIREQTLASLGS